jgi:NADPH:quinone reductase-like Zn-dependent oxidoreductase
VADQDKLAHKPATVPMDQAGIAAVSGITALQALTEIGAVQPGQRVLVIGASGGVGTYAVQLAKALGADVTGVAGTAKIDMVRGLGADRVIDYTTDDFVDDEIEYDLILDIGGRNSIRRLRRTLAPSGTLVIVGGEDGGKWTGGIGRQIRAVLLSPFVRQRLTMFISKEHHSYMEALATHLESGAVTPVIDRRYPLDDAAEALRRLEQGRTSGKSVIVVRPELGAS